MNQTPTPSDIPNEPTVEVLDEDYPTCNNCKSKVAEIKYLDYQDIRVVFHSGKGCILGTVNIK